MRSLLPILAALALTACGKPAPVADAQGDAAAAKAAAEAGQATGDAEKYTAAARAEIEAERGKK